MDVHEDTLAIIYCGQDLTVTVVPKEGSDGGSLFVIGSPWREVILDDDELTALEEALVEARRVGHDQPKTAAAAAR